MRAINQQLRADRLGGLKLVVGPTGLGKTYAIPFVIQELHQREIDKGCIYTTHRHMLLEEMQQSLQKAGIYSVYLKSNPDLVADFIRQPDLPDFLDYLNKLDFFDDTGKTLSDIHDLIEEIADLSPINYPGDLPKRARKKLKKERKEKNHKRHKL